MKLCEQELPGEMLLDLELMFFMSSGINVCNVFFRLKKKSFFVCVFVNICILSFYIG